MADNSFKKLIEKTNREKPGFKEAWQALEPQRELALILMQMRKASGLTQSEVAKKAEWKQSQVARMESLNNEMPKLKSLAKFAKACGAHLELGFSFRDAKENRREGVLLTKGAQEITQNEIELETYFDDALSQSPTTRKTKPDIETWLKKIRAERKKIYGKMSGPVSPADVKLALVKAQALAASANQILARCAEASKKWSAEEPSAADRAIEVTLEDASGNIKRGSGLLERYTHVAQSELIEG